MRLMKMRRVQVSEEYLESLCEWMKVWPSAHEDNMTVPQFLRTHGIAYPFLKYFCYISEPVMAHFDLMKAELFSKWLLKALGKKKMSTVQEKVLLRYIRLYDSHGMDIEQESKEAIAAIEARVEKEYEAENYGNHQLSEPYQKLYDANDHKRRGETQAK